MGRRHISVAATGVVLALGGAAAIEGEHGSRATAQMHASASEDARPHARTSVTRRQMRRWRLTRQGLGPIRVGRTVAEVERRTDRRMVFAYGDRSSCRIWRLGGAPRGLSIMTAYGRIARVQIYFRGAPDRVQSPRGFWRTKRRIRLGHTEARVRRRYGHVRSRPHPYTVGRYLIVGRGNRRIIFETNSHARVTSFRGGRKREVRYIEGCA
ncbi:MAG TPA: hypothetical protein VD790_10030 [Thermoleophilaceae bacterium]|nr:hypothetical protein [Thermoleophilaceae bacterium]